MTSAEGGPQEWAEALRLRPHPEGGFFRETYRADELIQGSALPGRYEGEARAFSTAILFLLPPGTFSALHELRSDELWHYHAELVERLTRT